MLQAQDIKSGMTINAQIGNPSDSYGYVENQEVEVIGKTSAVFVDSWCIKYEHDGRMLIGVATIHRDEHKLYCTCARLIGDDDKTEADLIEYFM